MSLTYILFIGALCAFFVRTITRYYYSLLNMVRWCTVANSRWLKLKNCSAQLTGVCYTKHALLCSFKQPQDPEYSIERCRSKLPYLKRIYAGLQLLGKYLFIFLEQCLVILLLTPSNRRNKWFVSFYAPSRTVRFFLFCFTELTETSVNRQ